MAVASDNPITGSLIFQFCILPGERSGVKKGGRIHVSDMGTAVLYYQSRNHDSDLHKYNKKEINRQVSQT